MDWFGTISVARRYNQINVLTQHFGSTYGLNRLQTIQIISNILAHTKIMQHMFKHTYLILKYLKTITIIQKACKHYKV